MERFKITLVSLDFILVRFMYDTENNLPPFEE